MQLFPDPMGPFLSPLKPQRLIVTSSKPDQHAREGPAEGCLAADLRQASAALKRRNNYA
jgi:hypothetical protein